jgi:hypothetical protein
VREVMLNKANIRALFHLVAGKRWEEEIAAETINAFTNTFTITRRTS